MILGPAPSSRGGSGTACTELITQSGVCLSALGKGTAIGLVRYHLDNLAFRSVVIKCCRRSLKQDIWGAALLQGFLGRWRHSPSLHGGYRSSAKITGEESDPLPTPPSRPQRPRLPQLCFSALGALAWRVGSGAWNLAPTLPTAHLRALQLGSLSQ
jgi:hypothetical protein